MSETGMRAYEELKDITIPKEQEEMMNIICDAWKECQKSDCRNCIDRPTERMRMMACTALKYTRLLLANGYSKEMLDAAIAGQKSLQHEIMIIKELSAKLVDDAVDDFIKNVKQYIDVENSNSPDEKVFSERDIILIVEKIAREMR